MFRAFVIGLFCSLFCLSQSDAAMLPGRHRALLNRVAAGQQYSGPGDIVGGASVAYSCSSAYSGAYAAANGKLCRLVRASDSHACDVLSASNGYPGNTANCSNPSDNGTLSASWVSGTTANIAVAYDQSGNGVDANITPHAPQWQQRCLAGYPCIVPVSGGTGLISTATINIPQPYTVSSVAIRTGGTTAFGAIIGCGNSTGTTSQMQSGFYNVANEALLFAGTTIPVSTLDLHYHSLQYVYNGANSSVNADGTLTSNLNAGSGNCTPAAGAQYVLFAVAATP